MPKANAKKAVVRRRREKKNIERGAAHIQPTFNNTIVTITDVHGNALSWLPQAVSASAVPENPLLLQHRVQRRLPQKQLWSTVLRLLRFS